MHFNSRCSKHATPTCMYEPYKDELLVGRLCDGVDDHGGSCDGVQQQLQRLAIPFPACRSSQDPLRT